MAQKKLLRFAQIKSFENVLEYPQNMQGGWCSHFKNDHPITLELACGRGEYSVSLAKLHPNKNFIGIDIKGNRMYIGAKKALDEKITNVAFLRTQIDKLTDYFAKEEIDEIWITFPDPQLRLSKAKKRLTHPRFLRLYQQVLKSDGCINLKTDSPDLYLYTKKAAEMLGIKMIEDFDDTYKKENIAEELKIKTHYESLDIAGSKKIHYLRFKLPQIIVDIDKELQLDIEQNALNKQIL